MNRAIFDTAKRNLVMTCYASLLDFQRGTITFANAGHNFPYLYQSPENQSITLWAQGNRLGDFIDSEYATEERTIKKGDLIVWYTDGLIEGENHEGKMYGERRLKKSIQKCCKSSADKAMADIISDANQFYGTMQQLDDITLIVGKVE
jgi:sigma-B regulation protein RsbU (phosphoserine phosphatase)